jgi:predicted histone-like DNA-binding protein
MKYKLIQRKNPRDLTKVKWYALPVSNGRVNKPELSAEIVSLSSLSRGDVSNVIENMIDVIPKYLLMGKSVSLGELGIFRISFSSDGVDDPGEFTVALIRGVRIIFIPSPMLKKAIENLRFEKSE